MKNDIGATPLNQSGPHGSFLVGPILGEISLFLPIGAGDFHELPDFDLWASYFAPNACD
jgi:hypothetical protein